MYKNDASIKRVPKFFLIPAVASQSLYLYWMIQQKIFSIALLYVQFFFKQK